MSKRPLRIGLTGGIGSGKSTVARQLAALGATVVDADALARACTQANGTAVAAIRAQFGDGMMTPDGAMDRDRMRQRVFADPSARAQLEAIVHPQVRADIDAQVEAATTPVVVLDLPLLAESAHWQRGLDEVWVVDCEPETQILRVSARNGWPPEQIQAVMAAQASRAQRLALADVVIANGADQTLSQLESEVIAAWGAMQQRFGL